MGNDMGQNITIDTRFSEAGLIEQTIDMASVIQRRVMNVSDQQIHDALVAMGWTPPGPDIAGKSSGEMHDTIGDNQ
jgi:hypothetical protein